MIVRTLKGAIEDGRKIESEGWNSIRMLLKDDNMGFSFHITTIYEGANLDMHYKNHLESVFCISGEGEIEDMADGKVYPIEPGTIYLLDKHDKHQLRAKKEMIMACVFNPPLHGKDVHDETGAYPLEAETI